MVGDRVARGADRARRRVRPRLHLFGPSGGLRGRPSRTSGSSASWGWWSACATTSARICRALRRVARPSAGRRAETCGLMGALQLVQGQGQRRAFRPRARRSAWSAAATASPTGSMMRAVGDRMIIAPPLVITRAQIDEMVALIRALPRPDAGRRATRGLAALRQSPVRRGRRRLPLTSWPHPPNAAAPAFLQIQRHRQGFRRPPRRRPRQRRHRQGRGLRAARLLGLRQDARCCACSPASRRRPPAASCSTAATSPACRRTSGR